MKAIILLAIVAVASAVVVDEAVETQFQSWRAENGKYYASKEEYEYRLGVFAANLKIIEAHNAGNHSFQLGATRFADMTNAEYRAVMLPLTQDFSNFVYDGEEFNNVQANPTSVDWRDSGAVNAIKDQGQCGSCYSFGANAAMEAAWKMAGHTLIAFSEQNILDCSWSLGNQGCNGGWHYWAMDYVINNKGIDTMASYPYTGKSSTTCKYNAANKAGSITKRTKVGTTEAALETAVASHVVGIAIDASKNSFQLYKSGVYYESSCSSSSLDHAVAAIGYDNSATKYWIVRNSWGTSWGQKGYIWMSKDRNNNCGVATQAYFADA